MARLDKNSIERIRRSVKWTEGQREMLAGQPPPDPRGANRGFWAKLTGETTPGVYSWARQQSDGTGGLAADLDGATGTGTAFEANGETGIKNNSKVRLYFAGFNGSGQPIYLFVAEGAAGYALAPCTGGGTTIYTTDELREMVGQIVKVEDLCYTVSTATLEALLCNDVTCEMEVEGPFESCCECGGIQLLTLADCDDLEDPLLMIDVVIRNATVVVGDYVRHDDHCYLVVSIAPCEGGEDDIVELLDEQIFTSCEECRGECFDLNPCDTEMAPIAVRGPNIAAGDVIRVNGQCYTAADRECTGSETEITIADTDKYEECGLCQSLCDGDCLGKLAVIGEAATEQLATEAAIASAEAACASRGITVCSCLVMLVGENLFRAIVCYTCCCPEGSSLVDVVTDVACEDGEIIVTKEKRCLLDNDCSESCP